MVNSAALQYSHEFWILVFCFFLLWFAQHKGHVISPCWWLDVTEVSGTGQVQLYPELEGNISPWVAPFLGKNCFLVAPGKLSFMFTWQGLRCSPVLWMYWELGRWGFGILSLHWERWVLLARDCERGSLYGEVEGGISANLVDRQPGVFIIQLCDLSS